MRPASDPPTDAQESAALDATRAALRAAVERGGQAMVGRRLLSELVFLSLIAQENVLLIGPPGTGKSAAARLAAQAVGGRYFEYLIGRFTEPSEIFGPLDLAALQQGKMRPNTAGMLPEAELAFLDEIFLGSTAILNTLLGVLNERRFRRGEVDMICPLKSCVAASNHFPEDPMLRAFADRFLVTAFIDPVGDHALETLLDAGWRYGVEEPAAPEADAGALSIAALGRLTEAAKRVEVAPLRPLYAHVLRKLRARGVAFSDRRIVKGQTLIASAAAAAGRSVAAPADLWPVAFMAQDRAAQAEARDTLQEELSAAESPVFSAAAQAVSVGAAARAEELRSAGVALLENRPALQTGEAWEMWLVRAESLLAQIDAGFARDALPEALAALRAGLSAAQAAGSAPGAAP
ncbi:MAG: AAA family ATPase [Pseudomonadota bacterium]